MQERKKKGKKLRVSKKYIDYDEKMIESTLVRECRNA